MTASRRRGSTGKSLPVLKAERLEALKQAAIDQNAMIVMLDGVFGSGNRAGAAQERQCQRHLVLHAVLQFSIMEAVRRPPRSLTVRTDNNLESNIARILIYDLIDDLPDSD